MKMVTKKLCRAYNFKLLNSSFDFTPKHKFNFVIDEAATGKTWLVNSLAKVPNPDVLVITSNNINFVNPIEIIDKLIIIDESTLYYLMLNYSWNDLQNSENVFLFISRNIPAQLSVDYRAIYTLKYSYHHYTLVHKFPYLQKFKKNKKYITEDSKSGYQYFSSKLNNVETAEGKDNLLHKDLDDCTIIADGSAFARILLLLQSKYGDTLDLFLPESFEGLVISYNDSNLSHSIYANAYSDTVLKYKSIEDYFTNAIKLIYNNYTKKSLPDYIKFYDLLNINHCGITDNIAKRNDINKFNYIECKNYMESLDVK